MNNMAQDQDKSLEGMREAMRQRTQAASPEAEPDASPDEGEGQVLGRRRRRVWTGRKTGEAPSAGDHAEQEGEVEEGVKQESSPTQADPERAPDDASQVENKKHFDDMKKGESLLLKNESGKIVSLEREENGYSIFIKEEAERRVSTTEELLEIARKEKWQLRFAQKTDPNAPPDPVATAPPAGTHTPSPEPQDAPGSEVDPEELFREPAPMEEPVILAPLSELPNEGERRTFVEPAGKNMIVVRRLGDDSYAYQYEGVGDDKPLSEDEARAYLARGKWQHIESHVEERELPVSETLAVSLHQLEDVLFQKMNETFQVKWLKIEPAPEGASFKAEIKGGLMEGEIIVKGAIVNSRNSVTFRKENISGGKKTKRRVENALSHLDILIKQYVKELYGNSENPLSRLQIEGSNIVIGFAKPFTPEELELLIGGETLEALAGVMKKAKERYEKEWAENNDPADPTKEEEWKRDALPLLLEYVREEIASLGFLPETQEKIFQQVLSKVK